MTPWGRRALSFAGGDVVVAIGVVQQQRGAADFEGVIDFRRHVAIVERRGHEPCFEAGQIVNDERRAIGHERRDAIAGREAEREILRGEAVADVVELPPGHLRFVRDKGQVVWFRLEPVRQEVADRMGLREGWSGKRHRDFLGLGHWLKNWMTREMPSS